MLRIGYPVYSLATYDEDNTILVAGGGGKAKTGVENAISVVKVLSNELELVKKHPFPDCVSMVATSHDKKHISAFVGPDVMLFDQDFKEISKFSTPMASMIGKCMAFSPNDDILLIIDGDFTLYLLKVPTLEVIASRSPDKNEETMKIIPTRACFHGNGESIVLVLSNEKKTTLNKPIEGFPEIASLKGSFGIETKSIYSLGDSIIINGINTKLKQTAILLMKESKGTLMNTHVVKPTFGVVTSMVPTKKSIATGTNEGDVYLLNKSSLGRMRVTKRVHGFPVTSMIDCGDVIVSGSLDATIKITPNKEKSFQITLLISIVILAIAVLLQIIRFINK